MGAETAVCTSKPLISLSAGFTLGDASIFPADGIKVTAQRWVEVVEGAYRQAAVAEKAFLQTA